MTKYEEQRSTDLFFRSSSEDSSDDSEDSDDSSELELSAETTSNTFT